MFAQNFSPEEMEVFTTYFFCPKCYTRRLYIVKSASVDFTFYFIPLFEARNIPRFVVCQACKNGFDPEILKPRNQTLFKLVWATKCELRQLSPEALKSKLLSEGLKERLIDKLITLAQS